MLITTGIILVLAALLFPLGQKAMASGKKAKALSSMKTLLGCASNYQAENGTYAYYRLKRPNPLGNLFFYQYFPIDYLDYDAEALRSPYDDTWDERVARDNLLLPPTQKKTHYSYAMNLSLPLIGEGIMAYPSNMAIHSLSQTAFFIECMGTTPGIRGASANANLDSVVRYAHRDGEAAMVGYLDYHIDLVNKKDLLNAPGGSWDERTRKFFWSGVE